METMEADSPTTPLRSLTEFIYVLFLRLWRWPACGSGCNTGACWWATAMAGWAVSIFCLCLGVSPLLALRSCFPVAALGLWLAGSWDPSCG